MENLKVPQNKQEQSNTMTSVKNYLDKDLYQQNICPCCGYCKHCGRGGNYFNPYINPYYYNYGGYNIPGSITSGFIPRS